MQSYECTEDRNFSVIEQLFYDRNGEIGNMKTFIIVYFAIVVIHFICEYVSIKKECTYNSKPRLSYCFFRALFFPITWIRLMWEYTKPE